VFVQPLRINGQNRASRPANSSLDRTSNTSHH